MTDDLKKGTLLLIETGEYSDKSWGGPVRLLKSTSRTKLADAFKKQHVQQDPDDPFDRPDPRDFLPWLIKSGFAEAIDNFESWHVGSYGSFEP